MVICYNVVVIDERIYRNGGYGLITAYQNKKLRSAYTDCIYHKNEKGKPYQMDLPSRKQQKMLDIPSIDTALPPD